MPGNFSAVVGKWAADADDAIEDILRESTRRVVEVMQKPRSEGGDMAILTGFLQDSLRVSKTVMPVMNRQGQKYTGKQIYFYDERPIEAVIATMVPGETLYIGYTATYAWDVNYRFEYLFVDLAAQQWPQIVKAVESEVIQKRGLR